MLVGNSVPLETGNKPTSGPVVSQAGNRQGLLGKKTVPDPASHYQSNCSVPAFSWQGGTLRRGVSGAPTTLAGVHVPKDATSYWRVGSTRLWRFLSAPRSPPRVFSLHPLQHQRRDATTAIVLSAGVCSCLDHCGSLQSSLQRRFVTPLPLYFGFPRDPVFLQSERRRALKTHRPACSSESAVCIRDLPPEALSFVANNS
jgi:hypothetical protein